MLQLLQQMRKEMGVTQTDLMRRLDLDQSSISRIETGDRRIDPIELRKYCIAIGVPFVDFIAQLESLLATEAAGARKSTAKMARLKSGR
jgi:transcriptional regulator with XRE-family HTH domain